MEYASPIRRMFALILDGLVCLLIIGIFLGLGRVVLAWALEMVWAMLVGFLAGCIGCVVWWMIALASGQTPGKQLLGIRAIRQDGSSAGWGITFVREIIKIVAHSSTIGFFADAILMLIDDAQHRSLSDRAAGTAIVRC